MSTEPESQLKEGMRLRPSDWWFWENRTLFLCFGNSFWIFKKQLLANPTAFLKHAQRHMDISWKTRHESSNCSRSEPVQVPRSPLELLWTLQVVRSPPFLTFSGLRAQTTNLSSGLYPELAGTWDKSSVPGIRARLQLAITARTQNFYERVISRFTLDLHLIGLDIFFILIVRKGSGHSPKRLSFFNKTFSNSVLNELHSIKATSKCINGRRERQAACESTVLKHLLWSLKLDGFYYSLLIRILKGWMPCTAVWKPTRYRWTISFFPSSFEASGVWLSG